MATDARIDAFWYSGGLTIGAGMWKVFRIITTTEDVERSTLVKVGKLEHLKQLRETGCIYMNPVSYFRGLENDELRQDHYECSEYVTRGNEGQGKVTFPNGEKATLNIERWELWQDPKSPEKTNLFCKYALRPDYGSFPVNQRIFDLGDHSLVMMEPQSFIRKIEQALSKKDLKAKANLVSYVDQTYQGPMGPFRKRDNYAYQSEWRLIVRSGSEEPFKLYIGDITDISIIINTSEINQLISVAP